MRKIIGIICAGALMFSLVGCSNQAAVASANKKPNNNVNNIEVSSTSSDYGTIREVLEVTSKNLKIFYPKLQGYKGELSMDYMNQSIKQIADFYANNEDYTDVKLDYEVKKLDEKMVSIIFKGTGKLNDSREIKIQKSINLDVKSTNSIDYENYIKDDEKVRELLDVKAKSEGITGGFEAEGVFIYFEGDRAVFYYMPLDDSAKAWVELSVPLVELEGLINTEFGEHPAS
jgi:hypothetical protein